MNTSLSTLNCLLGHTASQHTDPILSEETWPVRYASRSPPMPSAFQGVLHSQRQTSSSLKLNLPLCIYCAHWVLGSNPLPLRCFPGSSGCSRRSAHALQREGSKQKQQGGQEQHQLWAVLSLRASDCLRAAGQDLLWKLMPTYFSSKTGERVSLRKRKQNKSWVIELCWCSFSSAARNLENILVFWKAFEVGIESFLFCISKSSVLCVLLF